MPSTTRHAFPSPASTAVPDVPVDIKAAVDAIDLQTPWVTTSTPAHSNGLIWRHPTTGKTQISDGTSWFPLTNGQVIGGKRRTTNAANTSGATELQVLDTGAIDLLASSLYRLDMWVAWTPDAVSDTYVMRIRDTNTSGTVRMQASTFGVVGFVPYSIKLEAPYVTTSAETGKVFVGTVARLGGSGTCRADIGSFITVTYMGSSSLLGTL